MLVTDDMHEVQGVGRMLGAGLHMWRTVSLELQIPYILVRFATQEGPGWLAQTSLLWREEDLIDFCSTRAEDPCQRILQIARLSPPVEEGQTDWRLITLAEIWKGVHTEPDEAVLLLIGEDGSRMAASGLVTDVGQIRLVECIYASKSRS
jgi:hypothetical protein